MELVADKYKQTEIGLIPEDWELRPVGDIFTFFSTANYSKAEMAIEGEVGCVHYGLIHAIENSSYSLEAGIKYYISEEQAKYEKLQNGDVVMVDASEDLVGLNKSVEVYGITNKEYIAGLHTFHLRDKNSIYVDSYRGLVLNSDAVKRQMLRLSVGMKVFGVSKSQLRQIIVLVPTKTEQTAIATALSDMDSLISNLEELIEKKRMIKQGVMHRFFEQKENWVYKKLRDCLINPPEYGINAPSVPYSDNLPTYLRITDISNDGTFLSENKTSVDHPLSSKYILSVGDVVFARTGASVGKTYLHRNQDEELVFAGFLIRVRTDPSILNPVYLKNFTNTEKYWQWVTVMSVRSGQPGINGIEFSNLEIPVPINFQEQDYICEIFESMDNELLKLTQLLIKYNQIKIGMMQSLLTGKIRLI